MKYVLDLKGHKTDPLTMTEVLQLYQSGAANKQTNIREEDRTDWLTLEQVYPFLSDVRTFTLGGLAKLIFFASVAAIPTVVYWAVVLWLIHALVVRLAACVG
jgi:hypothetical protein